MFHRKALLPGLILSLFSLLLACGSAATPTPAPTATPPAATQPPTATQPAATLAPAATKPAMAPTAAPTPTPALTAIAAPVVNPGKVIWMSQGWGTGRFEQALSGSAGAGNQYARIMHGFLIAADASGKMTPGIAEDWSVSADGKTWTVTIRDGALFHDGQPVTNQDVAWSWIHEFGPDAVTYAKYGTSITQARNTMSIQAVGTNQVAILLKNPDGTFPAGILSEAGPTYLGAVQPARGKPYDEADSLAYDQAPIGAGPMKVVRQVAGDLIAMERFDAFYYQPKNGLPEDRRVNFQSLDLRLVPEVATRVAALRAGETDIAPISIDTRNQVEAGGGRLVVGPEGAYIYAIFEWCWSPNQPPCKDKRVRQAFAYALDKKLIGDKLYGGPELFQQRGWAFVTPGSLGYSQDLDPFPYDPDKARQLLAEAGYPGGAGFGKLIVNTFVSPATPFMPEQAQLAADMWHRELGIETEVKVGDQAALSGAERSGELWGQLYYRDNETRYEPSAGSLISSYGSADAGTRRHEDKELLAQVQAVMALTDPATRPGEFNKLYKRLRDEQWDMSVGYLNIPWGVGPKVTAWQPFAFASYPSGLHTIRLK